jgi:hypothetical protein
MDGAMDVKNSENEDQKVAEEKLRTWCIRNDAEPDMDLIEKITRVGPLANP